MLGDEKPLSNFPVQNMISPKASPLSKNHASARFVPFNRATCVGTEDRYVSDVIASGRLAGDGLYGRRCEDWFARYFSVGRAFLTSSGTHALEMAAMLLDLGPGDEVIMPSFTFPSTATAFALRGACPVFIDVRPDTMNIDETCIEAAITPRTRAIVVMHYGGTPCNMDSIMALAHAFDLRVIEDAAHSIGGYWQKKPLGTIGDLAAFSFHETKNVTSGGEGGLIWIRDPNLAERAKVIREKGTNRDAFRAGTIDKYEWCDIGSSYVMADMNAAYLLAQLEAFEIITATRGALSKLYRDAFDDHVASGRIEVQHEPEGSITPGHLFYIKLRDEKDRSRFMAHMSKHNVSAAFHYSPLHTAPAGLRYGRFKGEDKFTTKDSARLVRLPLFSNISMAQCEYVIEIARQYLAAHR
jgi:dTDP-4-amino-4,6-dideoxygalactose transaminase